ncbi:MULTISPECIES: ACP S-malonyltransferase [unclassified Serratia (in: enterobacteria)]|uniref:ACP S-malonyltransferase n=1 Tax=unclassified Serratia (in: enterobacteria) TaxID=2647522 RepID=UPI0005048C0F|nr:MULTISPECIES: ACP S-malonyltransferase [unclassified Serratia (in: enterobacteria)]KFK94358.1 malonyl CoA-ACP transacylase [Serratia sp. Ag2]KFK99517.1 malonyl CoA-ACP transacylase [Serratia sp. Ag1]
MDSNKLQSVAFLFAGQGNPTIGMGSDLWGLNGATKRIWDCASDVSGIDIRRLCLKGPMNKLVQTTNQQVAVTAINATLYTLCRDKLEDALVVGSCGHSVGEYSALYAADAITLEDLFRMIHFRSQLMDELSKVNKGTMLAVKSVDYSTLSDLIANSGLELDISCDNSHRQQVIGGTPTALRDFTQVLIDLGYDTTKLGVSGAWHTRLMAEGVQRMQDFLSGIEIRQPQHDVLMNVTATPETDPELIKRNLSLHLTHTVKWTESMERFLGNASPLLFIEVSSKPYLAHILNDFNRFSPDRSLHCRKIETCSGVS